MKVRKKKHLRDLHKKHEIQQSPIKLNILYKYDFLKQTWLFSGYRCYFCDRPLSKERMQEHSEKCKIFNDL